MIFRDRVIGVSTDVEQVVGKGTDCYGLLLCSCSLPYANRSGTVSRCASNAFSSASICASRSLCIFFVADGFPLSSREVVVLCKIFMLNLNFLPRQ